MNQLRDMPLWVSLLIVFLGCLAVSLGVRRIRLTGDPSCTDMPLTMGCAAVVLLFVYGTSGRLGSALTAALLSGVATVAAVRPLPAANRP